MKPLEILYEDETCFVLNKPAGLSVQGGEKVNESVDMLLSRAYAQKHPRLVHRLDKDTSGVLLVAKGAANAAWYSQCMAGRKTLKHYIAVCAVTKNQTQEMPLKQKGLIDIAIDVHGKEKKARTQYRQLKQGQIGALSFAVLELELETGRFHQIRRHLRLLGCPILGDDKYGDFSLNKLLRKTHGLRRLLLHARRLSLPHPGGGLIDINAPPPPEFTAWL